MALYSRKDAVHPHVRSIIKETGAADATSAVRLKARAVVEQYQQALDAEPPFNMLAIASFRGLRLSDDDPRYSADSEIAPEANGRVVLRVNKQRPPSRQRFSIGHEIGHTLFPDYHLAVQCRRTTARGKVDPDDEIETLCDVAGSEFLFPIAWFSARIADMKLSADAISALANDCLASRDATVRRLVEVSEEPLAAIYFSWKLKPTELREVQRTRRQRSLSAALRRQLPSPKLRVDYAITNQRFDRICPVHIPKDKSIASDGPIHTASQNQAAQSARTQLDLGPLKGSFDVIALPLYTDEKSLGPDGCCSVVAVVRPARSKTVRPR